MGLCQVRDKTEIQKKYKRNKKEIQKKYKRNTKEIQKKYKRNTVNDWQRKGEKWVCAR